ALDAARAELLALDVVLGEGGLDAIELAHAMRRTIDERIGIGVRGILPGMAPTRHVLGDGIKRAVAVVIAQRGVNQRDEEHEGSGKIDDLEAHRSLRHACGCNRYGRTRQRSRGDLFQSKIGTSSRAAWVPSTGSSAATALR